MVPVRRGYIGAVALANLGITIAFFTPIQSLLPRLAQEVAPDSKEAALAWITGAGAFASIFFNPLAGALSDRTTSRWGRRKPWVLGGALVGAAGIVLLGVPGTVLGLALVWFGCQAAINGSYAGLTATIPDQVPSASADWSPAGSGSPDARRRRRRGPGLLRRDRPATRVRADRRPAGAARAALRAAGARRGAARSRSRVPVRCVAAWVLDVAREYPDFGWAWITRFLMMLGNSMATLYLLFWLQDEVGSPSRSRVRPS